MPSQAAASGRIAGFWTRLLAQLIDLCGWAFAATLVGLPLVYLAPGTFGLASALPAVSGLHRSERAASRHQAAGRAFAEPDPALLEIVLRLSLPQRDRSRRGARDRHADGRAGGDDEAERDLCGRPRPQARGRVRPRFDHLARLPRLCRDRAGTLRSDRSASACFACASSIATACGRGLAPPRSATSS